MSKEAGTGKTRLLQMHSAVAASCEAARRQAVVGWVLATAVRFLLRTEAGPSQGEPTNRTNTASETRLILLHLERTALCYAVPGQSMSKTSMRMNVTVPDHDQQPSTVKEESSTLQVHAANSNMQFTGE